MIAALRHETIADTFEHSEQLLHHLVHKYRKQHGVAEGEHDDLMSLARFALVKACDTFDVERGYQFNTWLGVKVRSVLTDQHGRKQNKWMKMVDEYDFELHETETTSWTSDLSDDARVVVNLVLEDGLDILDVDKPKSSLRTFLEDLRWSSKRITESFKEIGDALS